MKSSTATGTTGTAERPAAPRRGRFAPSPTGPLHAGSLLAAVGSYLDARAQGGEWLLRMEDVDRGRDVPGAADDILRTLEAFGLDWDGPVLFQSSRGEAYAAALSNLRSQGLVYDCSCSRAELGPPDIPYPGSCRPGPRRTGVAIAQRFLTLGSTPVTFVDRAQGPYAQSVADAVGDFVLRRRDGYWAYQLAVVVDDAASGITDVVRGHDLLDNTPRQRLLQAALGLPYPTTLHLPLLLDADGTKRSKSRQPLPADTREAPQLLTTLLTLLRHPPPPELRSSPVVDQLAWAIINWNISLIHNVTSIYSNEHHL